MIGGGSSDPAVFSDEIFSFRRMTLAPILVLAGYGIQIYAILKKTTNTAEQKQAPKPKATKQP
jgi:F0F1-type ATP synthase assembly protein I